MINLGKYQIIIWCGMENDDVIKNYEFNIYVLSFRIMLCIEVVRDA